MESIVVNHAIESGMSPKLEPGKWALAIHTASPELGLAISDFSGGGRSHIWDLGREMSTQLHHHLNEFLHPQRWADLAFIAVAQGPGGFTGTRIGVVTARTLAQQLDIPLFAISTLQTFAWATLRQQSSSASSDNPQATAMPPPADLAVELAARRGEVYGAIYTTNLPSLQQSSEPAQSVIQRQGLPLSAPDIEDVVLSREQWSKVLASWPYPYQLAIAEQGLGWTAPSLLDLAYQRWTRGDRPSWSAALPYYGQSPV
jgi:tRNA threonylcarbamoyl adenosine modification protein YeaZ